jgi:flagellar P-ring protein precursor FlgI
MAAPARPATAQDVRVRDLTVGRSEIPIRLVGYGLVTGLEGTGDRVAGGSSGGHTVRSVANLLRRFDVVVPDQVLRTRNVAAVLVTAEVSPYLRAGGRFEIHVSSVGDASSLRGGVLWITPLVAEAGGVPLATGQGSLLLSDPDQARRGGSGWGVETTGRLPEGGILEQDLPRSDFGRDPVLQLREPDLVTADRIAAAVNASLGEGTAAVEDPGAVALTLPQGQGDVPALLARIGELTVTPRRDALVVIDGRDGTVVAGGDLQVGPAMVSHGELTLTLAEGDGSGTQGDVRVTPGATVQDVASALHAVAATPGTVAAVFESLRTVGALTARVVIR